MKKLTGGSECKVNEEKKSNCKGRPTKLYSLIVPISQIINVIEEKILAENILVLENIECLKKMYDIENIE